MTLLGKEKKKKESPILPKIINCNHYNLIPLEINFAQVTYPNGYSEPAHYNYAASGINANVLRVKTYYCLDCKSEINAPRRKG